MNLICFDRQGTVANSCFCRAEVVEDEREQGRRGKGVSLCLRASCDKGVGGDSTVQRSAMLSSNEVAFRAACPRHPAPFAVEAYVLGQSNYAYRYVLLSLSPCTVRVGRYIRTKEI